MASVKRILPDAADNGPAWPVGSRPDTPAAHPELPTWGHRAAMARAASTPRVTSATPPPLRSRPRGPPPPRRPHPPGRRTRRAHVRTPGAGPYRLQLRRPACLGRPPGPPRQHPHQPPTASDGPRWGHRIRPETLHAFFRARIGEAKGSDTAARELPGIAVNQLLTDGDEPSPARASSGTAPEWMKGDLARPLRVRRDDLSGALRVGRHDPSSSRTASRLPDGPRPSPLRQPHHTRTPRTAGRDPARSPRGPPRPGPPAGPPAPRRPGSPGGGRHRAHRPHRTRDRRRTHRPARRQSR